MLSNIEKETIVLFNEAEPYAEISTFNGAMKRKLERLTEERPGQCELLGGLWGRGTPLPRPQEMD